MGVLRGLGHLLQVGVRRDRLAVGQQGLHGLRLHVDVAQHLAQAIVQLAAHPLAFLGRGQRTLLRQQLRLRRLALVYLAPQLAC